MNPHPLVGITPDNLFQGRVDALGIGRWIAAHFNLRIKTEHIAAGIFVPKRKTWNNRRPTVMRQLSEHRARTSKPAEKVDENAFRNSGVLIDEDADRLIILQRLDYGTRRVLFVNQPVSGESAAILYQGVDTRVIQRPNHNVQWLRHDGMRESAEFPVAEMRRCDQDAAAGAFRGQIIVKPFVGDPIADIRRIQARETGHTDKHAGDALEDTVDDRFAPGSIEFRERKREIRASHAAQSW